MLIAAVHRFKAAVVIGSPSSDPDALGNVAMQHLRRERQQLDRQRHGPVIVMTSHGRILAL